MLIQNQFDIEFQKTCLVGCNVLVYYPNGLLLQLIFDKKIIRSFKMKRVNNGIWDTVPHEETTIEIVGWKSLTEAQKNNLKVDNIVIFKFAINGYETTANWSNGVEQFIESVTIDDNDDNVAIIKCSSLFKHKKQLVAINNWQNIEWFNYLTYPMNITKTEELQVRSLSIGCGFKIRQFLSNLETTTIYIEDDDTNFLFLKKNIIGKVKKYEDVPNKSLIETIGVDTNVDNVTLIDREVDYISRYSTYKLPFEQQSYVEDYQGKALIDGTWQDLSKRTNLNCVIHNGGVEFNTRNYSFSTLPTKLRFIAIGKKVRAISNDNAKKSVMCRIFLDTETDKLEEPQRKMRNYYSFNVYYEFDCRFDPRIEPQDCIFVEDIGILRVEETQLTFNGGFKGHIKGRLIQAYNEPLKDPTISTFDYSLDTFELVVDNPTPFDVTLHIEYDGGEITKTLTPFNSKSLTQATDPALVASVNAYINGTLENDVYCYISHDNGQFEDSDNVVIMQANA